MSSAASRGVLLGACAGLLLGLNDFGAIWLWLEMGSDRWALLLRLLGIHIPVGAFLGGFALLSVAALTHLFERVLPARLARHSLSHAVTLLLAPATSWIAWQLFTGGSASRLPMTWLLRPLAALVLIAGTWLSVAVLRAVSQRVAQQGRDLWWSTALIAIAHGLIKLNQTVLPNLYDYLHGVLTVTAWSLIVLALHVASSRSPRIERLFTQRPWLVIALLLPLGVMLNIHVAAIPTHQNVAVALLDPRASHSRTLMLVSAPWLQSDDRAQASRSNGSGPAVVKRVAASQGASNPGAHILLVTIDALRADHLGAYGYERPTSPQLDALAAQSLVFERAYAQAPHSSYSLCSLMTSEYLHETLDLGAPPPEATLATTLTSAGYHTAAFYTLGIFHTAAERLSLYERNALGFALHDHQDREPEAMTDRVLEEIDRTVARGEPSSLIWAHYFNVHEPYRATTLGTSDVDRYDSEIQRADAAVDRLIREARQRFKRELVVVITADHGEEFREHGGVYHGSTLYEEQLRVPLIINAPSLTAARVQAPVEVIDIAPTLLDLVGIERPASMRGDNLRSIAARPADAPYAFSAVIHKRMVVRWPHKLIADLRFGLYELYDLSRDPHERKNLASSDPKLMSALREEVYRWLDSLAHIEAGSDPRMLAIDQGRLGDRRAVVPLIALIQDESAPSDARREAGMILGKLADKTAAAGLIAALKSKDRQVAGEAAIALGRMHNEAGRDTLRSLVNTEDPDVRSRAAVSLGRLRDTAAVPALIDALWIAPNDYEREEAIRWLGRLRDSRALEPLISLLPESRTRHLVVVAMGALGDPRAFDTLRDVLRWETHANIRDNTVRGLGMLKDPRGLDLVLPLAIKDPTLKYATESLVRLNALERGAIGGCDMTDAASGAKLQGFVACTSFSERHDWDYLHRTICETSRAQTSAELALPEALRQSPHNVTIAISARRIDAQEPATLRLEIGNQHTDIKIDTAWTEQRWSLPASAIAQAHGHVTFTATPESARFAIDHVLVLSP